MNNKQIGGRGKKAPYETTHVRIPIELKSQVEILVREFKDNGFKVADRVSEVKSENSDNFIQNMIEEFKKNNLLIVQKVDNENVDKLTNEISLSCEQARELANELLASRGTKKELVNKLLTALYQVEVNM